MAPASNDTSRLLITGAGGMLGGVLCRLATSRHDVFGIYFRRRPCIKDVRLFRLDLTRRRQMEGLLAQIRPRAVIHVAAMADVGFCQRHAQQTVAINIRVPAWLAAWCARERIPYGFASTDLVFDGDHAPYDESRPVGPLSVYARQKAEAERDVRACYPQATIFRLPLLLGLAPEAPDGRSNFCRRMLAAIHTGRQLVLFTDEYRTPVDVVSAAEGMLAMISRHQGLLHLGGRTRISRYRLGLMMAATMARPSDGIKGITVGESGMTMPRARDVSLDSRRAYALGYKPVPLEVAVQRVVNQYLFISKS